MVITALHAVAGAVFSVWLTAQAQAHAGASTGAMPNGLPWIAGLVGALALGFVGYLLARRVLPAAPAWLRWDGAAWSWRRDSSSEHPDDGAAPLQRVLVSMDLGAWLLLQLVPAGGSPPRWRVASAGSVGAAWHGLRVALQAHAGDPRPPDEEAQDRAARRPGAPP